MGIFKNEVIVLLQRFIQTLNENGYHIEKAYLYGSYAKAKATHESDIDVMLISELFDKEHYRQAAKIWVIAKNFHERIEPYMVGVKKFTNDEASPLIEIVKHEGVKIPLPHEEKAL